MKIIILNDYAYINGGISQVALSTAVALANQGQDIILFTAVGPIASFLRDIPNLRLICLQQYDILNDPIRIRAAINGIWNWKARNILREELKKCNKDTTVVHVHACAKALSSSCVNLAIKEGYAVIYHLHDYGVVCPNMGFYNYLNNRSCELLPMGRKCILENCDSRSYSHKCWRVIRQWVQYNIGGIPQKIHCIYISKFSYRILKKFLDKKQKSFFLENPIDVEKEERVKVEENKYFVFIGRLSPEKNPVFLAKVAKQMKLPMIFVGSGICKENIRNIYPESQITGWLEKTEINNILKKTRCLIFPSSWYETQGLVVFEAMARGIPCIVTRDCAASEGVVDGENGFLFTGNNSLDLEMKIKKLRNDSLVQSMGRKAYEYFWKERRGMERHVKELLMIYENVLK